MDTQLFQGDCLDIVRNLDADSVHLVYLDPPFFTQKTHRLLTKDRRRAFSFDDVWSSHAEFADFLHARLKEIRRVMHPAGSLFFHCDRNASHIVRFLLEELFGADNFRSEIIWHYKRWSNSQKNLLPAHQTFFFFTKSDNFTFNTIYEDYSVATNVDQILQRRKRDAHGKSVYELDESGDFILGGPKKGVPLSDVWHIPFLNPKAKERVGYPTQKPVLLLERIIQISSNENDLILDPFCGSGTTIVAATLLNRRSIGIDISRDAIEISRSRLAKPFRSESNLLKSGRDSYRSADQDALAMLKGLDIVPVQRNKGIDAFLKDDLDGCPVPIRVQRPHETIPEAASLLYKAAKTKRARLMFLIAIQEGGYFPFGNELPSEICVIDGPALSVAKNLESFKVNREDR
jgi:site-specific DNA-methyltransferase (adenine-specific)